MRFFWYIYVQPLRRIGLVIVLLVFLGVWLKNRIEDHYGWRIFNVVVIAISIIAIFYCTLFSRNEGVTDLVLIPLQTFIEAKKQPELYRSMLMNVFLFVPFGLSMPNIAGMIGVAKRAETSSQKWEPVVIVTISVLCGLCLSAAIEFCQYKFSLGRCEVDDVIMNTLGTAIGAMSYIIKFPKRKAGE